VVATSTGSGLLSDEHEKLRSLVQDFAREEVAPVIGRFYAREEFPYEIVGRMGQMGLFGLPFPQEYGGGGKDHFSLCIAVEELARVDSSVAITLAAAVGLGTTPIYRFGTEEQKRRWLPELCRGQELAAFGLTEPSGGSAAAAVGTTARREGDEWVVNGTKCFITNGGTDMTSVVTVAAVTGAPVGGRAQISAILVPAGTAGFSAAKKYSKVGWCASDTRELNFSDCRVPLGNLVGEEGRGYPQFLSVLDEGRIAVAALSVGLAQGCVDQCLAYMQEREIAGRKIGEFQALQFKLADMEARAHVARLAWYEAASRLSSGRPFKKEAAIAKLFGSDVAMANAREAAQIFGGWGFMNETPVGRFYRDAKILEIGEGTSEIQRTVIARHLGLRS
jgi:alkylation response protein AidB-like acyl-CoA dehydrogenase